MLFVSVLAQTQQPLPVSLSDQMPFNDFIEAA
jgi:hypothetical protein